MRNLLLPFVPNANINRGVAATAHHVRRRPNGRGRAPDALQSPIGDRMQCTPTGDDWRNPSVIDRYNTILHTPCATDTVYRLWTREPSCRQGGIPRRIGATTKIKAVPMPRRCTSWIGCFPNNHGVPPLPRRWQLHTRTHAHQIRRTNKINNFLISVLYSGWACETMVANIISKLLLLALVVII